MKTTTAKRLAAQRKDWARGATRSSETVRQAESIYGIRQDLKRAGLL